MNYYEDLFTGLFPDRFPYYRSWSHDCPMIVSPERDDELREIQHVLYKAVSFYASSYEDYLDVINYDPAILRILSYVKDRPFRAGTWRPDYLILTDGRIRLCEITSRFFGNGYFLSYFMEHAGKVFAEDAGVTDRLSYFEEFFRYMASLSAGRERLVVLKSTDKSDSIRLYVPFYEALGMKAFIYEAEEVENHLDELPGAMVVSALNQNDLLSFSDETRMKMADAGMINDFRTIFLLHDKRFFRLFLDERFMHAALTEEEADFLRAHAVETFLPDIPADAHFFDDARIHKDRYILKHHCLGKSERVFAGCLTEDSEWENLFSSGEVREMILQPFMEQKLYRGPFNGGFLDDYVSGTILTVDDRYFGTGLFRTSTSPVINQRDAHKIAPLITREKDRFPVYHEL